MAEYDAPSPDSGQETPEESPENMYWAARPKEEIGTEIADQVRSYYETLEECGLVELYRVSHAYFYGLGPSGTHESSKIIEFGDDGEKLGVRSNQLRSLIRYIHTSATADRPAVSPKAINATAKALAQIPTAKRVLEYYHFRKKLEKKFKAVALRALLYGKGYLIQFWDPSIGPMTQSPAPVPQVAEQAPPVAQEGPVAQPAQQKPPPAPKPEGDLIAKAGSPLDTACDLDRDEDDHDWFIHRRLRNKYDVAAVFAKSEEEREKILECTADCLEDNIASAIAFGLRRREREGSDLLCEYHLIHRKTPSLPKGRYTIMVGDGLVLFDGDLPYEESPVSEMVPEEFMDVGSAGYASAWDLIGLQQGYDALLSTCLTNFDAWGYNDILLPEGVELGYEEVRDGLNVIRYPVGEANKPEILEKFSIKEEAFKLKDWLRADMEVIPGVNGVARGEPEASLKSGAALALVQAQAIHFQSSFIASYVNLIEDASTKTIKIIQQYASPERIAAIGGANDPDGLKAFSTKDISMIDHIECEHVNPLFRTISGRTEVADTLLERGLLQDPSQYFQVLETGRLEAVTDPGRMEHLFMESVKERLMAAPAVTPKVDQMTGMPVLDETGQPIMEVEGLPVTIMDHPVQCLLAAKSVLYSLENRANMEVVLAATTYAMNVMRTWRAAPKDMLQLLGYPLPPMLDGDAIDPAQAEGGEQEPQGGPPKPPNGKGKQSNQDAPPEGGSMPSLPKPAEDPLKDAR